SGERGRACSRFEARLDRAVDEAGPAVRKVRSREDHAALRAAHLRMVAGVPPGPVDRPGSARILVREPVVGGCSDELVAGKDLVERLLHRPRVLRVAARRIDPEADLELRAVAEQRLGVEIAERVAGPNRVLEQVAAAGAEEDLDPARGLS